MYTPAFFCFADMLIGLFFCNCKDEEYPGSHSCVDLKGESFSLVKVNAESGTYGWFTENKVLSDRGDDLQVRLYCV